MRGSPRRNARLISFQCRIRRSKNCSASFSDWKTRSSFSVFPDRRMGTYSLGATRSGQTTSAVMNPSRPLHVGNFAPDDAREHSVEPIEIGLGKIMIAFGLEHLSSLSRACKGDNRVPATLPNAILWPKDMDLGIPREAAISDVKVDVTTARGGRL